MNKYIAIPIVVLLAIIGFERVTLKPFERLPSSEPTQVEKFMDEIAKIETPGGGYHTVNQYGMMGRYQFSLPAIRAVGLRVSKEQFLKNPELQDTAMVRLMRLNEQQLEHYINRYDGKMFKGIKITRAAILAGAHFAGSQGVRNFFINNSQSGTVDGNGTTLRYYMSRFSDFHLPQNIL